MKTIGLIGGMSWESTIPYYRIINEEVKNKLGGLHSAKIILYSVDFDEIEKCQSNNEWEKSGEILGKAAQGIEAAGADFLLICTNTMHKVVPQIAAKIRIPVIHIADATADVLVKNNIRCVGLLGTKYTMTQNFYKKRLTDRGIDVLIPEQGDIETVNNIIFNELCLGEIKEESRVIFQKIISKLRENGAEGVILGCTEIGLLISQSDVDIPVFDTTMIHAKKAAELALDVCPINRNLEGTMLDRTIPFCNTIMKCSDYEYRDVELPDGFSIVSYQPGFEREWAKLECAIGDFDSETEAERYFVETYLQKAELFPNILFAMNKANDIIGSCIAWQDMQGINCISSLHWLVVDERYQRIGIGRALCTAVMNIYAKHRGLPVYIHTQPWSWKAILLYISLGFKLQKTDTFSHYVNEYEKAMIELGKITTEEQYELLKRSSEE